MKKILALTAVLAATGALAQGVGFTPPPLEVNASPIDPSKAKPAMPFIGHVPAEAYDLNRAQSERAAGQGASGGAPGGKPSAGAKHKVQVSRISALEMSTAIEVGSALEQPQAIGGSTLSLPFSSTRTYPRQADLTYPQSAVGKLFFRKPDGLTYVCSASAIKPGVIVTAGHCVHSGNGAQTGWYNSWTYVPGYRVIGTSPRALLEGRPFGTWTGPVHVRTTSDWYIGGGGVPNLRDIAVIVYPKDQYGYFVGQYTGWLGYQYPAFIGRHVSVVGYPVNLDGGGLAHRVEALAGSYGSVNNGVYGSDMTGGSSGGPIVLNLREDYSNTAPAPLDNLGNRVVSVVSWGYTAPVHKVQGGSAFDTGFDSQLINPTCAAFREACGLAPATPKRRK